MQYRRLPHHHLYQGRRRGAAEQDRLRALPPLAETPGDGQLRRQLLRVYQADIKTVDAFCTALLRENTHLLAREEDSRALTPDFRVLDEGEAKLVRQRVLARELEDFYDHLDAGGALLADTLGAGRDDSRLAALVLELHDKVQSHADPAGWLAESRSAWGDLTDSFDDTPYAAELLASIRRKGTHWGRPAGLLRERTEGDEGLYRGYGGEIPGLCRRLCRPGGGPDLGGGRQASPPSRSPGSPPPKAEGRAGGGRIEAGVGAVQGGDEEAPARPLRHRGGGHGGLAGRGPRPWTPCSG